jgi:hypothetical protein
MVDGGQHHGYTYLHKVILILCGVASSQVHGSCVDSNPVLSHGGQKWGALESKVACDYFMRIRVPDSGFFLTDMSTRTTKSRVNSVFGSGRYERQYDPYLHEIYLVTSSDIKRVPHG